MVAIGAVAAVLVAIAVVVFAVTRDESADPDPTEVSNPDDTAVLDTSETSGTEDTSSHFTLPPLTLPSGGTVDATIITAPPLTIPDTIVVADNPTGVFPPATETPDGLGADAQLDELAGRCYDGGLIACDLLWTLSPLGSAYETYADTCAGRQPTSTQRFCSQMAGFPSATVDLSEISSEVPDSFDTASCWAGDMAACDVIGVSGSEPLIIDLGTSCGGRQEVGLGGCAASFPEYAPLLDPTVVATTATTTTVAGGAVPPAAREPTGLGDDADLNALAEDCHAGTMGSCDDLYFAASAATEYRIYGDTCAGRQPAGSGMLCTVAFPG
ncbi:MAG: hypothetical protein ACK5OX_15350 [Desertimonas sp.]